MNILKKCIIYFPTNTTKEELLPLIDIILEEEKNLMIEKKGNRWFFRYIDEEQIFGKKKEPILETTTQGAVVKIYEPSYTGPIDSQGRVYHQ